MGAKLIESRINTITVISGMQGVRKTTYLKKLLRVLCNGNIDKKGQRILIYDVNKEYTEFKRIPWKDVASQPQKSICRVVPVYKENGIEKDFDTEQLKDGFQTILDMYSDGVIVLEDFNSYSLNTRKASVTSTLNRARHKKVDLIIVLQEIDKVTKEMWATCGFYEYFMQLSEIDMSKNKIKLFFLAKIADNIVKEQYEMAAYHFDQGWITEDKCKDLQSFHVTIDYFKGKIFKCHNEGAFRRAVDKFLKVADKYKQVKDICREFDWDPSRQENIEKALNYLYERRYKRYWGG